ncbi:MAG TPA: RuBisCO large subunit C-terminal-like domain-containing protein, partial [Rhodothermales bacterium]
MDYLRVTFRVDAAPADVQRLVESVLLEQTVETPADVAVRAPFVRDNMMGRIEDVRPASDGAFEAVLDLPTITASVDVAQFLNVLFGNASLHERVSLVDFDAPEALLERFPGPRFGVGGIRERFGVFGRPLTCSAIKPVGLDVPHLAALCRTMALGGVDVIKDDHYLANHPTSPFRERVAACQRVVDEVSAARGRSVVYCPNLSGTPDAVRRQWEFARECGVRAVMVAPMLLGLPSFYELIQRHIDVPVLVHPSFAGSTRIGADTLIGKLLRLFGGDAVIFANYGGRFSYDAEVCAAIARRLREPWHHVAPSMPVPAGGMTVERTRELVDF